MTFFTDGASNSGVTVSSIGVRKSKYLIRINTNV